MHWCIFNQSKSIGRYPRRITKTSRFFHKSNEKKRIFSCDETLLVVRGTLIDRIGSLDMVFPGLTLCMCFTHCSALSFITHDKISARTHQSSGSTFVPSDSSVRSYLLHFHLLDFTFYSSSFLLNQCRSEDGRCWWSDFDDAENSHHRRVRCRKEQLASTVHRWSVRSRDVCDHRCRFQRYYLAEDDSLTPSGFFLLSETDGSRW